MLEKRIEELRTMHVAGGTSDPEYEALLELVEPRAELSSKYIDAIKTKLELLESLRTRRQGA